MRQRQCFADARSLVSRTIIDNNHFDGSVGLSEDARDRLAQHRRSVVDRDHCRNQTRDDFAHLFTKWTHRKICAGEPEGVSPRTTTCLSGGLRPPARLHTFHCGSTSFFKRRVGRVIETHQNARSSWWVSMTRPTLMFPNTTNWPAGLFTPPRSPESSSVGHVYEGFRPSAPQAVRAFVPRPC